MVEDPKVVVKTVWILDSTRVICSTWREEHGHLHPSYKLITIWLVNIAMERSTIFKNGKPSISMGHL